MYDLLVLGGGPGGYMAAERAGKAGLSVLLIEKNKLGGVCLNEGCVPSKTLLNSAKIFDYASHSEKYGVTSENARLNQETVINRKNKVVKALVGGIKATLQSNNVIIKDGLGMILGRENGIIRVAVNSEVFEGKNLIIATGSEAVVPPIPGVREGISDGSVMTNREILDLRSIPESLAVIGGGVIGLEMANYFHTAGSKVTVIEMLDHIAGSADRQLSDLLLKIFTKKGITFQLNCKVTAVGDGKVTYTAPDGQTQTVLASKTLLSIGRTAVLQGFGLENLGVYTERGRIVTDAQGRTNVPGVYAAGDVNGVYMLAHAAYREAEVAVNTILGRKDTMRYQSVPSVLYTNPEMAFVGETEETCIAKGIRYEKTVLPMNYSGRYMAENEGGEGIIKLIIDPDRKRVLGCHLLGSYASEMIVSVGIMIESEMCIDDIKEVIFPHPTVSEIIREAIFHSN